MRSTRAPLILMTCQKYSEGNKISQDDFLRN